MKRLMWLSAVLAILPLGLAPDARAEDRNEALLGVVAVKDGKLVRVSAVLPDSPAAAAGLEARDVLLAIGAKPIQEVDDVHAALREAKPEQVVPLVYGRGKKRHKAKATVIARKDYAWSNFVGARGGTGFKAPEWHVYAWANVSKKQPAPSRENTKGKVVVIHCFQSW